MARLQLSTRSKPNSAIASRTGSRRCFPIPGRIRLTTFPPMPTSNVPPGAASSDRASSDLRHPAYVLGRNFYDIPAPGSRNLEVGPRTLVHGFDHLCPHRSAGKRGHRTESIRHYSLSGATSVQRPNLVPNIPLWISDPNVAGGKRINKAAFTNPTGPVQGTLGRNVLNGFGAAEST